MLSSEYYRINLKDLKMELLGFIIIAVLVWSVFTIGSVAFRNPLSFIFAIVGLSFLFGDDDCDV